MYPNIFEIGIFLEFFSRRIDICGQNHFIGYSAHIMYHVIVLLGNQEHLGGKRASSPQELEFQVCL